MPSLTRLIAGATATTGVVITGRLGVIVAGCIAGLAFFLICSLAMVAVFGSRERQPRAELVLGMLLGRVGNAPGSAGGTSGDKPPAPAV